MERLLSDKVLRVGQYVVLKKEDGQLFVLKRVSETYYGIGQKEGERAVAGGQFFYLPIDEAELRDFTLWRACVFCRCRNFRVTSFVLRKFSLTSTVYTGELEGVNDNNDNNNNNQTNEINGTLMEEYISKKYTENVLYSGQHSYHYHRNEEMNTPTKRFSGHRIGIELEVCFNSGNEQRVFVEKKSNWFYKENDGSLDSYGTEIITIPLLPEDAKNKEFWKVLTDDLEDHARSWETGCCGLHVHIGREILGRNEEQKSETLGKLLYLYHHYVKETRMNIKVYGRERGYNDHDGKSRTGDAVKLLGNEVFKMKDVPTKVKDDMISTSSCGRYFDINLQNEHTIEFRKGRGSINPKRIASVVEYCERMCIYAKTTPWVQISYEDFRAYLMAVASEDLKSYLAD